MDWSKRELALVRRAADVFDLPADVIGGLPHIELLGDCQLLLSGHQGILSMSRERIDINGGKLIVRLGGRELELTASELRVQGQIEKVELVR